MAEEKEYFRVGIPKSLIRFLKAQAIIDDFTLEQEIEYDLEQAVRSEKELLYGP